MRKFDTFFQKITLTGKKKTAQIRTKIKMTNFYFQCKTP